MTLELAPHEDINIKCGNFHINIYCNGANVFSIEEMKIRDESTVIRTKHTDYSYTWILQKTFEEGFDRT